MGDQSILRNIFDFDSIPGLTLIDSGRSTFIFLKLARGGKFRYREVGSSLIVYLLSGEVSAKYGTKEKDIAAGNIFLLPKFAPVSVTALADAEAFVCRIRDGFEVPDRPYIQHLEAQIPDDFVYGFNTLPVIPVISEYIEQLRQTIGKGLDTQEYLDLKRQELFYYMKSCYSARDVAYFLYPLIGVDSNAKFPHENN